MAYQLFDENGHEIFQGDVENRSVWYVHGEKKEITFVKRYGQKLDVVINPDKTNNPTVPDLLHNDSLADLKTQNTPLFYSKINYSQNPTYSVTLNLKDLYDYHVEKNYQDFYIFYWVDWVAIKMISGNGRVFNTEKIQGIWKLPLTELYSKRETCPIHWYAKRGMKGVIEKDLILAEKTRDFESRLINSNNESEVYSMRGIGRNAACSYVINLNEYERVV
jgi:hypothetical protein